MHRAGYEWASQALNTKDSTLVIPPGAVGSRKEREINQNMESKLMNY